MGAPFLRHPRPAVNTLNLFKKFSLPRENPNVTFHHSKIWALLAVTTVSGICLVANFGYVSTLFPFVHHIPGQDVTCHFLIMGALALLVNLGFSSSRLFGHKLGMIGCTFLVLLAATLEELSQNFLSQRTFSVMDLSANYAGIVMFSLVAAWIRWRFATTSKKATTMIL